MDIQARLRKQEIRKEKVEVIQRFFQLKVNGSSIDRWGHIKVSDSKSGNTYRYKIMENVIRLETQIVTPYEKRWVRLKSYNFKKVYEKALKEL